MMDHEDFANLCLRIKNHDTKLTVPCCANCEFYKSTVFSDGETIYECYHPAMGDTGDEYISCTLYTQPEDFCNYFKERGE